MKQLVGALILLVGTALTAVLVLRIWQLPGLSRVVLLRGGATLLVLSLALGALLVAWFFFFKNPTAGYDLRVGDRAHPRRTLPPGSE